jgi:hypothetical protein
MEPKAIDYKMFQKWGLKNIRNVQSGALDLSNHYWTLKLYLKNKNKEASFAPDLSYLLVEY